MPRSLFRLLAVLLAATLVLAACGGGDDDGTSASPSGDGAAVDTDGSGDGASGDADGAGGTTDDAASPEPTPTRDADTDAPINGGKPVVEIPATDPPTELVSIDIVEGTGEEVVEGSTAEVHYVGVSWSTGAEFDSSWDAGRTFEVVVGRGSVIPGWDQGLIGMREGGRRELRIPPDLAYGAEGIPTQDPESGEPVIAPNETLVFVIDLVESAPPPDPATAPTIEYPDEAPEDLVVTELEVGDGEVAEPGDRVVINFVLGVLATRTEVASTWEVGQPFVFDLGGGEVETIPGLDLGVEGMRVGGLRQLVIPPGFGFTEQTGEISPEDTLVVVVELVELR